MAAPQILVVEDHDTQSTLVSFLLQEEGHTVQIAESAEAALELLRWFSPDLILLDLQLPGMDGLELARALRLNPVHRTTPIIALTAYTDPSDLERAREAGCNGKISKPIQTATFARQVETFLNPAANARADALGDSSDLLAEIRNTFLAEGLEYCGTFLKDLKSDPGCAIEVVQRVLHRWAALAGTLGFLEISEQAQKIDVLLTSANTEYTEVKKALENARRRFSLAARNRPRLPVELIAGLSKVRIGLVNVSEEEANRIVSTAKHEGVQVVIEQMKKASLETRTAYSALIVNECRGSVQTSLDPQDLSIPAVFIRSRSSLESLFHLSSSAYDFVIAPWDAEEILIRVYRLLTQTATPQPSVLASSEEEPPSSSDRRR
jgi:two-component system cell cycle response regulator DivK